MTYIRHISKRIIAYNCVYYASHLWVASDFESSLSIIRDIFFHQIHYQDRLVYIDLFLFNIVLFQIIQPSAKLDNRLRVVLDCIINSQSLHTVSSRIYSLTAHSETFQTGMGTSTWIWIRPICLSKLQVNLS